MSIKCTDAYVIYRNIDPISQMPYWEMRGKRYPSGTALLDAIKSEIASKYPEEEGEYELHNSSL